MLRAAEAWGRRRYGEEVVATGNTEPVCRPDGCFIATVELEPKGRGGKAGRTLCSVIMEPDGTVSCLEWGSDSR